jgi:hypothetical protein
MGQECTYDLVSLLVDLDAPSEQSSQMGPNQGRNPTVFEQAVCGLSRAPSICNGNGSLPSGWTRTDHILPFSTGKARLYVIFVSSMP